MGVRCKVATQLEKLDDEDQSTVRSLIYGSEPGRDVAATLNGIGFPIAMDAVWKHRNGLCITGGGVCDG